MRSSLRSVLLSVFACAATSFASAQAADEPLVFMTWGGVWQQTFESIARDYEAATQQPVRIVAQASADAGLARLIAQKDKPTVDVWNANMVNYGRAVEAGVLTPLPAGIPNVADVPEALRFSHGVTAWVSQRGIFYRKDLVPFEPKEWRDLWDPRLKGKMAAPAGSFDPGYFPLMASVINGGNERSMDVGYEKLKELRPSFVSFYTSNVQSIRLLEAGEVALVAWGVLPNVIKHLETDDKFGFAVPQPVFVAETPVAFVANSPRAAAAADFVDYLLSPPVQEKLAAALGSMPANAKAEPPAIIRKLLPSLDGIYKVDYDYLSSQLKEIIDRYNREIMN